MEWLIGTLIYVLVTYSIIAWEYRGNIRRYIYRPETRKKKGKTENEKDVY